MTVFYLLPLYVMLITGFKVRSQPANDVEPAQAWHITTCAYQAGITCGTAPGWLYQQRSSSIVGSINGCARWRFAARISFPLLFGMFIPYQSILIPLAVFRNTAWRAVCEG
jgi:glucose/mannose transport system permease protein